MQSRADDNVDVARYTSISALIKFQSGNSWKFNQTFDNVDLKVIQVFPIHDKELSMFVNPSVLKVFYIVGSRFPDFLVIFFPVEKTLKCCEFVGVRWRWIIIFFFNKSNQ